MKIKSVLMLSVMAGMALSSGALAAEKEKTAGPCRYTVMQNMIRDARSHEPIFQMIESGILMDDPDITCGGNLLQLAVRRGNANIVNGLVTQIPEKVKETVSLDGFDIPGAPESIPFVLFAAYYAPSVEVFRVILNQKMPLNVRDENGRDIQWYLEQNPVLRKTAIADEVQKRVEAETIQNRRERSKADLEAIAKERLAKGEGTVTVKKEEIQADKVLKDPDPKKDTIVLPNP